MKKAILIVLLGSLVACASEQTSILDRELEVYRYEQQTQRRKDLDELYAEERERSADLTGKILDLREKIREQERELAELQGRLSELERASAGAKDEIEAAGKNGPAPKSPAKEAPPAAK